MSIQKDQDSRILAFLCGGGQWTYLSKIAQNDQKFINVNDF